MKFVWINNKEEYKKLISSLEDNFGCPEDFECFFGFELKWNEETGEVLETIEEYQGDFKCCPAEFPALITHLFDKILDYRHGDTDVKVFDWITSKELEELKNKE